MILIEIIKTPIFILKFVLTHVINFTVFLSIFYTILYRLGIVQRLVQRHIERELSKISNGAQITITSMSFTFQSLFIPTSFFTTSTLSITELIIHTPHRNEWKWDSPLIARVGRLDVSFNLFTMLIIPNFIQQIFNHVVSTTSTTTSSLSNVDKENQDGHRSNLSSFTMKTSIKDIYSAQAFDVQVFIEKRGNVFNFHLLDPKLDLPDANQVLESIGYFDNAVNLKNHNSQQQQQNGEGSNTIPQSNDSGVLLKDDQRNSSPVLDNNDSNHQHKLIKTNKNNDDSYPSLGSNGGSSSSFDIIKHDSSDSNKSSNTNNDNGYNNSKSTLQRQSTNDDQHEYDDAAETKANEIVMSIVGAVSVLGQAVHQGGKSGLSKALQNQKDGFVSQLKKVKDLVGVQTNNLDPSPQAPKGSRTTIIAKESIQVIKQVGKVVEKNVMTMKEKVDAISKPPPIKESWKKPEFPELFRVGFVELRDVRIFTKEIMYNNRLGGGIGNNNNNGAGGSNGSNVIHNVQGGSGIDQNESTMRPNDVEFDKPNNANSFPSYEPKRRLSLGVNNWSKPIVVKEVRIYQTDLSPSSYTVSSMLKEKNAQSTPSSSIDTAAVIGLEIEQVSNIVMTRILTEIAKTNPGQLLTNAFSEVFKWFDVEA